MHKFFARVARWNAARYEQVLDRDLLIEMFREEFFDELLPATSEVNKLDALCDLSYFAAGGLWKMNLSDVQLNEGASHSHTVITNLVNMNELHPEMMIATFWATAVHDKDYPIDITCHLIIYACRAAMLYMGLSPEQCDEALLIVCDSNDTKPAKKTAANVKANIDKGINFISPEPRLQALLDRRANRG